MKILKRKLFLTFSVLLMTLFSSCTFPQEEKDTGVVSVVYQSAEYVVDGDMRINFFASNSKKSKVGLQVMFSVYSGDALLYTGNEYMTLSAQQSYRGFRLFTIPEYRAKTFSPDSWWSDSNGYVSTWTRYPVTFVRIEIQAVDVLPY